MSTSATARTRTSTAWSRNFGCCTANMHQGWPKFVSNLWMKTPDGGLAVVAYAPCVVETKIQGKPVKVAVETAYPFRDEIAITVTVPEPMTFPLQLRLPGLGERDAEDRGTLGHEAETNRSELQAKQHIINR